MKRQRPSAMLARRAFYRFDFDKGVPVQGGSMRWRSGLKTVPAYSLQDAINKFAMPVFRFGTSAKLNVVKAFVSNDKRNWREINLAEVYVAALTDRPWPRVSGPTSGGNSSDRKTKAKI